MPTWIVEAITKYTGVTNEADISDIYGEMCGAVRTFSGLSPAEWRREAKAAWEVVQYMRTPEADAEYSAYCAKWAA